jgi:putative heme transporter
VLIGISDTGGEEKGLQLRGDRTSKKSGRKPAGAAKLLAAIVTVGAIFGYVLPRIVDYGQVWATIRAMTWLEVLTLFGLAVWNQITYLLVEMSGRPGLGYQQAMRITQTSTAVANTLPGGPALGAGLQTAMYVSYGFAPSDIAISLTLTGIWNTFAKLGMPILALALLAIGGDAGGGLVAASVIGLAILVGTILFFAVALHGEKGAVSVGRRLEVIATRVGRLVRRAPKGDWSLAAAGFRRRTIALLHTQWKPLTGATLISHITLYLVLLLALRHVGVGNDYVSWQEVLASFAFVRLLSAVPITPGGLGVVELGLTATLVAAGGREALVVAAILVYRLLTFVLPIPVGAFFYFLWRRESSRLDQASASVTR